MDQSSITLDRMRTFVRVAERGSLSAVAREMAIGQSSVTRHIRELEEAAGGAPVRPPPRRVRPPAGGERPIANAPQAPPPRVTAGGGAPGTPRAPAGDGAGAGKPGRGR
ncbi:LysR family transcriptional regulator, partial [Azospirillum brasilense]|nr:LysR family transcriptional regulator [Azospirillum brasilense]